MARDTDTRFNSSRKRGFQPPGAPHFDPRVPKKSEADPPVSSVAAQQGSGNRASSSSRPKDRDGRRR